jgi:hypothetical protein
MVQDQCGEGLTGQEMNVLNGIARTLDAHAPCKLAGMPESVEKKIIKSRIWKRIM